MLVYSDQKLTLAPPVYLKLCIYKTFKLKMTKLKTNNRRTTSLNTTNVRISSVQMYHSVASKETIATLTTCHTIICNQPRRPRLACKETMSNY